MTTVKITVANSNRKSYRDSLAYKALQNLPIGSAMESSIKPAGDILNIVLKFKNRTTAIAGFEAFKKRFVYGSGKILEAIATDKAFGKTAERNLMA